jgi:hypothetical protein
MIGEVLWRRRFSADASIVGKTILLSAHAYRVVGILPATFRFPYASDPVEVWLPVAQDPRIRESQADQKTAAAKQLTTATQPSASPSSSTLRRLISPPAPAARPIVSLAPLAPLVPTSPVARTAPAKVTVVSQE